ncbi:MAG: glycosyltransferase family 4 protein [Candidatus Aminicenantes bacterium]|nr:glycosyltransferase family 4 protein [Candidatus Aminicenantes bacterium]MDH5714385.1 glycosyltransferase family 4 protein [Candidatus Aminicenantes bacterium]
MKKIKVMEVCDHLGWRSSKVHGVVRLFTFILDRFDKEKFDITYCCLREPSDAGRKLESMGARITYLSRSRFNPLTFFDLYRLFKENQVDVVHLHGNGASTFGRLAARVLGIPNVVHEHGVQPKLPRYAIWTDRLLAPLSYKIVAVGQAVRDWVIESKKVDPSRVEVIYFGVPLENYKQATAEKMRAEKERLNIPPDYKVVGTVSRLYEQKGVRYFIDAIPLIREKYPRVKFIVAGDGPLQEELEQQARQVGVEADTIFTGFCPDMPFILSLLDIKVLPSLWEGVPFTVYEAMAMGKPIVSTNVDGLKEVLEDGRNALMVPPKKPSLLAEKILYLLENEEVARSLGERAREDSKRYHINLTVRKFEELYRQMYALKSGKATA